MSDPAPPASDMQRTPLHGLLSEIGGRMVPFAGYAMAVQFPAGILTEHLHTRAAAGLFDVSHMGQAYLQGDNAAALLERLVPGDLVGLGEGRTRYTQLLDPDGNILDDLMVTRSAADHGGERLFVVVNAGTKADDFAHIARHLPSLTVTPLDRALLALQGPKAVDVLTRFVPSVRSMTFMSLIEADIGGADALISRSGYTGEDGFELSLPVEAAERFTRELLADPDVQPIGLGARDSLRLEAGLCLYGHDIDTTTNPVEAGLLWSIGKRRRIEGGFPGAERIRLQIDHGPPRKRVGLMLDGRAPAREGSDILTAAGEMIGRVSSGGFSPSLGRAIAMGYVETQHAAPGTAVAVRVRGRDLPAHIVPMPFVPHKYVRS